MRKNRTAVKPPVFVSPPLTTVNLIIDRINNRRRGQSGALRAGWRDETRRRRAGFVNKKKRRRRARGSPTASNSIPVVRERAINRVEIEEKGRLASRARLLCIALLLTQKKKKKAKEWEGGGRGREGMMEEKGVRKRGREYSRLNPAMVEQEIGLGRERELIVPREGRESVTATM